LLFGFVIIGRYGKWLTDINLLLIVIRQMAALVIRALAEVCPVSMLLDNEFTTNLLLSQTVKKIENHQHLAKLRKRV